MARAIASAGQSRNGPPEAVSRSRRTPAGRVPQRAPGGRHWKIALCSLSMGTSSAPPDSTARISRGPAVTADSLLASSRRLPAAAAARVERRPAAPAIAAMTIGASGSAASATIASAPASTRTPEPAARRRAARSAAASGSSSTAIRGACFMHWAYSPSTSRRAASECTRKRSGWSPSTASVERPMLPVLPRTQTPFTARPRATTGRWPGSAWPPACCRCDRALRRAPGSACRCPSGPTRA